MLVREQLLERALERGLRDNTVAAYAGALRRLGVYDSPVDAVDRGAVLEALWAIERPNVRRVAVTALRVVLGWTMKIPASVPRRYDLPDEDTLRLALMTSKFESRALLMMYAGLRVGEACAVVPTDLDADRLHVSKQVLYHRQSKTHRLAPTKTSEATVVVPLWLTPHVASLGDWMRPDTMRHSLYRAGKGVGISLNPHLLRHWYATTLIARGVPFVLVSKQLRHQDVAFTLKTYQQYDTTSVHDALGRP